jgi:hypothetical protein
MQCRSCGSRYFQVTVKTHEGSTLHDFAGEILAVCADCGAERSALWYGMKMGPLLHTRRIRCCGSVFVLATDISFGEGYFGDTGKLVAACAYCGMQEVLARG